MFLKQKYIKTKDKQIVVFSEYYNHSDFSDWKPISAGFISFGIKKIEGTEYQDVSVSCYGESVSLNLKSEEEDTRLAYLQILGNYPE